MSTQSENGEDTFNRRMGMRLVQLFLRIFLCLDKGHRRDGIEGLRRRNVAGHGVSEHALDRVEIRPAKRRVHNGECQNIYLRIVYA